MEVLAARLRLQVLTLATAHAFSYHYSVQRRVSFSGECFLETAVTMCIYSTWSLYSVVALENRAFRWSTAPVSWVQTGFPPQWVIHSVLFTRPNTPDTHTALVQNLHQSHFQRAGSPQSDLLGIRYPLASPSQGSAPSGSAACNSYC